MKLQHCIIFFTILLFFIGCIFYVPSVSSVTSAVQTYESPITHVQTTQNVLSLTFDLTNNNEQLSDILSLLDTYQVKATFLLLAHGHLPIQKILSVFTLLDMKLETILIVI